MRSLLNPKWLLALNSLPILILFFLFWNDFRVIKSLLSDKSLTYWQDFGIVLLTIAILNLAYALYTIFKKKQISIFYGFISLVVYITYIYQYNVHSSDIVPFSIPRWMLSSDLLLYVGTFLMPTLIHALFVIVIKLTSGNKDHKAWQSFLVSLAVPLVWYIFFQMIMPLWQPHNSRFGEHMLIIFMVIGVILFLFFLIRGIYIVSLKKGKVWKKYQLLWKIPISIIFPILGLLVNSGFLISGFDSNDSGIFGDFNSIWFFIIALINGILICLPNTNHKVYRLALFTGRSITLTYTLYFFLVFLPFLPLSIIAIIAIGVGFLMLTPLVLFVIHLQELTADILFLKNYFPKRILIGILFLSILILPACVSTSYYKDRMVLHHTLDYIYHPDYSKKYQIDKTSLKKTLNVVMGNKDLRRDVFLGRQTPYLSALFNWIVLDNLTLSDAKINTIERIFFNKTSFGLRSENLVNQDVYISSIGSNSTYDEEKKQWTSWIDLEITNANKDRFQSEYATTLKLPVGCWISDYYLYVGDRKEAGILAEKKSAMWVFNQIRNVRRDPGLLHYLTGNEVAFRVFPFAKNEIRKTGIQFIHKEPVVLNIDNHKIVMGKNNYSLETNSYQDEYMAYVSKSDKQNLERIQRNPYYHFIINTSKDKGNLRFDYGDIIDNFLKKQPLVSQHKVSFTNCYTTTFDLDKEWKTKLNKAVFEGGFYLERAIKTILFNAYTKSSNNYPMIIVVSDEILTSIIEKDFKDFKIAFPESDTFYHLNTLGYLASHSLTNKPMQFINDDTCIAFDHNVLAWPNTKKPVAYLADNNASSIVLKSLVSPINQNDIQSKDWNSGLLLQAKWLSNILCPEIAQTKWNEQVKFSFMTQIMTPLTSYIVVENEAQKAILKKKQNEVLSGKQSLDLNEDTQRMSEPELTILFALIGIYFLYQKRKLIL